MSAISAMPATDADATTSLPGQNHSSVVYVAGKEAGVIDDWIIPPSRSTDGFNATAVALLPNLPVVITDPNAFNSDVQNVTTHLKDNLDILHAKLTADVAEAFNGHGGKLSVVIAHRLITKIYTLCRRNVFSPYSQACGNPGILRLVSDGERVFAGTVGHFCTSRKQIS
jgi:hypothetical protein